MCRPPPTLPSPQILLESIKKKKTIKIHVLASIGKVKAPPPNFSKPVGTISNAMNDGNQYTKKEVGGRGGAYIYIYIYI